MLVYLDSKMQSVNLALVDGVFLEYAGTAAAIADAEDGTVDREIDVVGLAELVVVGCFCQLLCAIGQSRE